MARSTRSQATPQPAPARILSFPDFRIAHIVIALARGGLAFAQAPGLPPLRRQMALEEAEREVARAIRILTPHVKHPRCASLYREACQVADDITRALLLCGEDVRPVAALPAPALPWRARRAANRNAVSA